MTKPEGAGWLESSVEDRFAGQKVPELPTRGKHPNMQPVGEKAATSHGYKPCTSVASETDKN